MPIFYRGWFYALMGVALFACLFASLTAAFRAAEPALTPDRPLAEARAAFARVMVGKTAVPDLAGLGFDASRAGVQTLSYLGVMERFMPRTAEGFDRLDPAMQACLSAEGRCTAYVFPLTHAEVAYTFLGASAQAAPVMGPHVTLLIRGGRVAYKQMSER